MHLGRLIIGTGCLPFPCTVQVAADRRKQAELEDRILALLSSASGSLLDNVELINTLDDSKVTWQEVNESLKVGRAGRHVPCLHHTT